MSFRGGENKERGFFRSIVSSIGSSSSALRGTQSTTSSSSGSPNHEHGSMAKHNSFSGNLSFNRSPEDANGTENALVDCMWRL